MSLSANFFFRADNIPCDKSTPVIFADGFSGSYGVNNTYIKEKIAEAISSPVNRIHHFSKNQPVGDTNTIPDGSRKKVKKRGCYIATCVYKSYDCAEVWTLRRFRDNTLSQIWYGRLFIRITELHAVV